MLYGLDATCVDIWTLRDDPPVPEDQEWLPTHCPPAAQNQSIHVDSRSPAERESRTIFPFDQHSQDAGAVGEPLRADSPEHAGNGRPTHPRTENDRPSTLRRRTLFPGMASAPADFCMSVGYAFSNAGTQDSERRSSSMNGGASSTSSSTLVSA